jgi:deoxyribonuclease-4
MVIKLGPSGIGPGKDAIENLKHFAELGFKAAEVAFTYSVYLKPDQAKEIGQVAKDLDIALSIHAQYFVNLNSKEKEKIEASKKRILDCCVIGDLLAGKTHTRIVIHPGYYSDMESKEAAKNIATAIKDIQKVIKEKGYKVELCPELMGKVNVFGSAEEIASLVNETGCSFCIDFAHVLAREKLVNYKKIIRLFPQKDWHCHFSGIEYTEKGEKKHLNATAAQWKELFDELKDLKKDITIICESPDTVNATKVGVDVL